MKWLSVAFIFTGSAIAGLCLSVSLPLHVWLTDANIGLASVSVWAWLKWSESRNKAKSRKKTKIGIWD